MPTPNIILILNDDMGYSDIGCYGGEVKTPNLNRLADGGLRYTQFYNTARCCPSRASLLTGLHPHQANVGLMMRNDGVDGYLGDLSHNAVTIAEVLGNNGYATYMSGKWHITNKMKPELNDNWPRQRGFERYYGILTGATDFYQPHTLTRDNTPLPIPDDPDYFLTDAISDNAATFVREHDGDQPFFMYVAYTAPHWPLHAHEEDIARYKGRFDIGWDKLREERIERMRDMGILDPKWELSERDPTVPAWGDAENKDWQTRRMEVYAAQIDRMDQGIGRIIDAVEAEGKLDDTLFLFLADNGGCAEEFGTDSPWIRGCGHKQTRDGRPVRWGNVPEIMPGGEDTYCSYGVPWANVSDTPFRKYKHWIHEGGISTPFILHWPNGIDARGKLRHQPGQLPDVMATLLDVTGAEYPKNYDGHTIQPHEGYSLVPSFTGGESQRPLFTWEHHGNRGVRRDNWKLVQETGKPWELYDLEADRTECHDLVGEKPDLVAELKDAYFAWAKRCNVLETDELQRIRQQRQQQQ